MTPENFYWYSSILIFVPWLALTFAPNWRWSETLASVSALVLMIASAYFTIVFLRTGNEGGHVFSFDGIKNLFRNTDMLMTGWLNYLGFALLVGIWETNDAQKNKIPHIWVAPCLLLTFVMGPVGLLLYLLIRWMRTRSLKI
jgi:hypothetical protein